MSETPSGVDMMSTDKKTEDEASIADASAGDSDANDDWRTDANEEPTPLDLEYFGQWTLPINGKVVYQLCTLTDSFLLIDAVLPSWYRNYSVLHRPKKTKDHRCLQRRKVCGPASSHRSYTLQPNYGL